MAQQTRQSFDCDAIGDRHHAVSIDAATSASTSIKKTKTRKMKISSNTINTPHYLGLMNLAISFLLGGAVIVISQNLAHIPVSVFIIFFASLASAMLFMARKMRHKQQLGWSRTFAFWCGIFFGIALISAAHRLELLSFIPDLMLIWMIGLLLLGLWSMHAWMLMFTAVLNLTWCAMTFLYAQSYIPGVIIAGIIFCFIFSREGLQKKTLGLFFLVILNFVLLCNLYLYDIIHISHYPLQFSLAQLPFNVALMAFLWALASTLKRPAASPSYYAYISYMASLRIYTMVLGISFLIAMSIEPVWQALLNWSLQDDSSTAANIIGLVFWLLGALWIFRKKNDSANKLGYVLWGISYALFAASLTYPLIAEQASNSARLYVFTLALYWLYQGIYRPCLNRLLTGLGLFICAALTSLQAWSPSDKHYLIQVIVFWIIASVIGLTVELYRRKVTP